MIDKIKFLLGLILLLFHTSILPLFLYFALFYSVKTNIIILIYSRGSVLLWFITGSCIVTPIENYLLKIKDVYYKNGSIRSYTSVMYEKVLKVSVETAGSILTYFPLLICSIIFYKIYKKI